MTKQESYQKASIIQNKDGRLKSYFFLRRKMIKSVFTKLVKHCFKENDAANCYEILGIDIPTLCHTIFSQLSSEIKGISSTSVS